jgi:hypothetical protein
MDGYFSKIARTSLPLVWMLISALTLTSCGSRQPSKEAIVKAAKICWPDANATNVRVVQILGPSEEGQWESPDDKVQWYVVNVNFGEGTESTGWFLKIAKRKRDGGWYVQCNGKNNFDKVG